MMGINKSKSHTSETEVTVKGINFLVEYTYYKGFPATTEYRGGPPITPEEPPTVEIENIWLSEPDDDQPSMEELYNKFPSREELEAAIAEKLLEDD